MELVLRRVTASLCIKAEPLLLRGPQAPPGIRDTGNVVQLHRLAPHDDRRLRFDRQHRRRSLYIGDQALCAALALQTTLVSLERACIAATLAPSILDARSSVTGFDSGGCAKVLAVFPEGERRLEGLDDVDFSLGAIVPRRFIGKDKDVSGDAVNENIQPAVACDHGAGEAEVCDAGVSSDDALKTSGGKGQGAHNVHQRVDDHHVGGLGCLSGLGWAEVVVLDASPDNVEKSAVQEEGAELSNENPEVMSPQTKIGVLAIDPALVERSARARVAMIR